MLNNTLRLSNLSNSYSAYMSPALDVEGLSGLRDFTYQEVFDYTIQMVIAVSVVVVNGFVMLVIMRTPRLHTSTNFIIFSLALSDFGMGLSRPLQVLLELNVLANYYICLFSYCSTVALSSVSMQHLTFVSIDRFLRITAPHRYKDMITKRRSVCVMCILWSSSFMIAFMPMMGVIKKEFDGTRCSCEYFMELWFFFLLAIHGFSLSSLVLVFVYMKIFLIARRKQKLYLTRFSEKKHMSSTLRNLRAAKLLAVLCLYFLMSWMPFFILKTMAFFEYSTSVPFIVERVAVTIAVCNSLGNPILYAYWERNIRTAMKLMIVSFLHDGSQPPPMCDLYT